MNMKKKQIGDRVRAIELVGTGASTFIPPGTEMVIEQVYAHDDGDVAYRVTGLSNLGGNRTGVAFHDEIEDV